MDINDFLGYKFTCKISEDFKSESFYNENEFNVVIQEDSENENGYTAIVSGYDEENGAFLDEWDAEDVCKKLMFGTWDVIHKERL